MSNLDAFLSTIAHSEGTDVIGNRGYDCIVSSRAEHQILMTHYRDHPRIKVQLGPQLWSTAAGRYQILERYFDAYKERLRLPDFSPLSQDAIATQMIRERSALEDIAAGRFDEAIAKCSNIWASLPNSGYHQHENKLADLRAIFTQTGGMLA
jgi:muramidase (phage lysozyme)